MNRAEREEAVKACMEVWEKRLREFAQISVERSVTEFFGEDGMLEQYARRYVRDEVARLLAFPELRDRYEVQVIMRKRVDGEPE